MFEKIKKFFNKDLEDIKATVSELSKKFNRIPYLTLNQEKEKEKPKIERKGL